MPWWLHSSMSSGKQTAITTSSSSSRDGPGRQGVSYPQRTPCCHPCPP
jgi:hypothetical protein